MPGVCDDVANADALGLSPTEHNFEVRTCERRGFALSGSDENQRFSLETKIRPTRRRTRTKRRPGAGAGIA